MEAIQPSLLAGVLTTYPELVAIAVGLAGLIAARLASRVVEHLLASFNRALARGSERAAPIGPRLVRGLSALVFWSLIAVTLLLVLRTLGTGRVVGWIDVPLAYLPRVFVGLAIIGVGHVLGIAARNLVLRLQLTADQSLLAPRLVQGAILMLALITGLQHMGLDVSFVAQLLILLVGVSLAGLALAFALGARQHVANLMARTAVGRFVPGDRIRIDEHEGTIVEIHRTGVDLSTPEGVLTIPSARFEEVAVLRREGDAADASS